MTSRKSSRKGFTKADLETVSDNPEWTAADIAKAKPFSEAFPELAKTLKGRGPQKEPTKVPVSIRLSPAVVDHFKATGPGWQSRIDAVLLTAVETKAVRNPKNSRYDVVKIGGGKNRRTIIRSKKRA